MIHDFKIIQKSINHLFKIRHEVRRDHFKNASIQIYCEVKGDHGKTHTLKNRYHHVNSMSLYTWTDGWTPKNPILSFPSTKFMP